MEDSLQITSDADKDMPRTKVVESANGSFCPPGKTSRTIICCLLAGAILGLSACGKQPEKSAVPEQAAAPVAAVETPLIKATVQADLKAVKNLIDTGEDINAIDPLGRTALHMAAFYGNLKATELLLANGADITARDHVGMTALHAAVLSGGRQEVQLLLSKNADINAQSDSGQTALHLSAATGQPKLTKLLVDRGANPQIKDTDGKTPLFYAQQNTHPQTAGVLKPYYSKK